MTDRKFTTYVTGAQYEWLRRKAFVERIPTTEIVRRLITRAMEEEEDNPWDSQSEPTPRRS